MTEITSGCTFEVDAGIGHTRSKLYVKTAATAVSADTIVIDLAKYGKSKITGIIGMVESTAGSVVAQEQPTTAVSEGALTVTVGGTSVTKGRNYEIWME